MKLFKIIALVLVVVMSLAMLSGCGQNDSKGTGTEGTTQKSAEVTTQKTEQKYLKHQLLDGKPFDGTELKFLTCCGDVPQFMRLKEITDSEFTPMTGITVTWEPQPWTAFQEKLMTEAVSGSGTYDNASWQEAWGPSLMNYLVPLNEYIERDGIDLNDFPQAFLNACMMGTDKVYGLPFRGHFQTLFYRADIFEKLGLQPPKTWNEVIECGKLIEKETGLKGMSMNFAISVGQNLMNWYPILWGNGGDIFDENWKPVFNNDKGVEATQLYVDFLNKHKIVSPGAITFTEADANIELAQGKSAMFIGLSWLYGKYLNPEISAPEVVGNVRATLVPMFENQKEPITYTNLFPLGIFDSSSNKDAAWEYVKFITSKETDKWVYLNGGDIVVCHNSTLLDEEINATTNGMQKAGYEILKSARALPMIPEWGEVSAALEVAINNAASGADVKSELDKAAKDVEAIMKRAGYYK